jgi:hypothetical protein
MENKKLPFLQRRVAGAIALGPLTKGYPGSVLHSLDRQIWQAVVHNRVTRGRTTLDSGSRVAEKNPPAQARWFCLLILSLCILPPSRNDNNANGRAEPRRPSSGTAAFMPLMVFSSGSAPSKCRNRCAFALRTANFSFVLSY